jgi:8-oxo-dGTP diphosphatase
VVREVAEETGLDVRVTGLRDAVADVIEVPHRGRRLHTVRLLYDVRPVGAAGPLRPEGDGSSDQVRGVPPSELAGLALLGFTAAALGLPRPHPAIPGTRALPAPAPAAASARPVDPPRVQRAGAYAVVVDDGRVLLSRYAGDGRWSLPGGGIDFGEHPREALLREVHEETGLALAQPRLVSVSSAHFTGHAPDGRLEDFHAVRVIYTGRVPPGSTPRVVEVDGSTDAAAWVRLDALDKVPLSGVVHEVLDRLR